MTEAEFRALAAQGYNRIPLVLESFADLDTPLSLYVKLANARYTFLLESVVGGERFGRYSFIGLPARTRIRARGTAIEVATDAGVQERHEGDPLAFVGEFMRRYRVAPRAGLPRFCGGLAGYFGYDTVRHIEKKLAGKGPAGASGIDDVPDILLLLTEELAVVDNLAGKIYLIVYADPALPDAYRKGCERLQELRRKLREPVAIPYATGSAVTQADERVRRRRLPGRGEEGEGVHRRRRHHAGRALAAADPAVLVAAAFALPRAALAEPVAVHVLLRLRRLPRRRRLARDPRAQGRLDDHAAADRRHAAAGRDARGGRGARRRAARRSRRRSPST